MKYILICALILYTLFAFKKVFKSIKNGKCPGCNGNENCCCEKKHS